MSATREDVVAEARTWVGTPYHHAANIKGVGVDCAFLLIEVYCGLGVAPRFDPRPYKAQWFLHRGETIYLDWLAKYAHQVEAPQPGDVLMFNFGRHAAHGAIVIDADTMVHAYMTAGRVQFDNPRQLADQFHSAWSPFS